MDGLHSRHGPRKHHARASPATRGNDALLTALPPEILSRIASYLSTKDYVSLSHTSQTFNKVLNSDYALIDFVAKQKRSSNFHGGISLEEIVIKEVDEKKREREADRRKKHLRDFDLLKKLAKIVNTPFPITISLVLFLVFVLLFSTRLDGVCPRQSRQKAQPLTQGHGAPWGAVCVPLWAVCCWAAARALLFSTLKNKYHFSLFSFQMSSLITPKFFEKKRNIISYWGTCGCAFLLSLLACLLLSGVDFNALFLLIVLIPALLFIGYLVVTIGEQLTHNTVSFDDKVFLCFFGVFSLTTFILCVLRGAEVLAVSWMAVLSPALVTLFGTIAYTVFATVSGRPSCFISLERLLPCITTLICYVFSCFMGILTILFAGIDLSGIYDIEVSAMLIPIYASIILLIGVFFAIELYRVLY